MSLRLLSGLFLAGLLIAPPCHAAVPEPVFGLWYTEGKDGAIEIYPCNGLICGRIYWLTPPDDTAFDTHNPDESLREHPLCKLTLLTGFIPKGEGRYSEGQVYDPHTGSTYHAKLELLGSNELEIHGYILLPALGGSQIWTRAPNNTPSCVPQIRP